MPDKKKPEEPVTETAEAPYVVYMYTNKINGKRYVGQTKQGVEKRAGKNGVGYKDQVFGKAIKKYGWENFDLKIMKEGLTKEDADFWEWFYIMASRSDLNNGYNCTTGGEGVPGRKTSEETKRKISEANKGRKWSEDAKAGISGVNSKRYGKPLSDETRRKMSIARIGRKHSDEAKKKMSEASLQRPVIIKNVKTGSELFFKNIKEANSFIGSTHVSEVCYGRRKYTQGYFCRFATADEIFKHTS